MLRSVDPKTQTRSSARVNRYDRDAKRPNYHILPNTAVSRVLFDGFTAAGVEYVGTVNGTKSTVRARKEVIIAAGSVHTPQILQLSGIGDPFLLGRFGIKPISGLSGVGRNLQDHLVLKVNYNCKTCFRLWPEGIANCTQIPITSSLMVALFNPTQPTLLSNVPYTMPVSQVRST